MVFRYRWYLCQQRIGRSSSNGLAEQIAHSSGIAVNAAVLSVSASLTEPELLRHSAAIDGANTVAREASRQRPRKAHESVAATPRATRGVESLCMGRATNRAWRMIVAALVGVVSLVEGARAVVPSSEVPGSSPAGAAPTATPEGIPTPAARDPNFPKPEPLAPRRRPDSPPSLPGSGRQDPIPGS